MAKKVRSGDPQNIEAQAARRYWKIIFGEDFKRNRAALGINSLLNYGYTVLRSSVARAVIAAGLHPTLGLHHSNESNHMRLVDDLMEPFRPLIDLKVKVICLGTEQPEVNKDTKRQLVMTLYDDLEMARGMSPLMECTQTLTKSLAQVYLGERNNLELPYAGLPLSLSAEFIQDKRC